MGSRQRISFKRQHISTNINYWEWSVKSVFFVSWKKDSKNSPHRHRHSGTTKKALKFAPSQSKLNDSLHSVELSLFSICLKFSKASPFSSRKRRRHKCRRTTGKINLHGNFSESQIHIFRPHHLHLPSRSHNFS